MSQKRLPIEVLERARAVAKDRVQAPPPPLTPPRPVAVKPLELKTRDKVVAALKRLHPMD